MYQDSRTEGIQHEDCGYRKIQEWYYNLARQLGTETAGNLKEEMVPQPRYLYFPELQNHYTE